MGAALWQLLTNIHKAHVVRSSGGWSSGPRAHPTYYLC